MCRWGKWDSIGLTQMTQVITAQTTHAKLDPVWALSLFILLFHTAQFVTTVTQNQCKSFTVSLLRDASVTSSSTVLISITISIFLFLVLFCHESDLQFLFQSPTHISYISYFISGSLLSWEWFAGASIELASQCTPAFATGCLWNIYIFISLYI